MDSSIENEVLQDFKTALSKIDFKDYNPNSSEFMMALNLGLMWKLIKKLNCSKPEVNEKKISEESSDEISDEIFGAKKYLQKYSETQDSMYKEMAGDELKHANFLIKKAYSKLPSGEEKMKLKSYEDEIKMISDVM